MGSVDAADPDVHVSWGTTVDPSAFEPAGSIRVVALESPGTGENEVEPEQPPADATVCAPRRGARVRRR